MIVLDASATAFALLDEGETGDRCRAALQADSQWLVPEHWLIEVLSVIRGNLLGGKITPDHAAQAAAAVAEMDPIAVRTRLLAVRIWELRSNLTTYDAAYVAAAERYRCALVTTDARLARAAGIQCTVNLIPMSATGHGPHHADAVAFPPAGRHHARAAPAGRREPAARPPGH